MREDDEVIVDVLAQFVVVAAVVLGVEATAGARARPWPRRLGFAGLYATVFAVGGTAIRHSEELFGVRIPWWGPLLVLGLLVVFSLLVEARRARRRRGYRGAHLGQAPDHRD